MKWSFGAIFRPLFVGLALSALIIQPARALDTRDMRHLLDRTGFGIGPRSDATLALLDRAAAVDRLLSAEALSAALPDWAQEPAFPPQGRLDGLTEAARQEARRAENRLRNARLRELKALIVEGMIDSDAPLIERMTLFWHNHFTSEQRSVRSPQLMLRQHLLIRHHALGNLADLLRAVAVDPAMLIYLDGRRNHRKRPNENFARELLELFTLGEGHYSEADIQAAARALTGWTVHRVSGKARFVPRRFDDGEKRFLGQSGHWGLDGIIAVLLAQPRTAEFIVEKLWVEFVSPQPEAAEVERLAEVFRDSGYEIAVLMRALLSSDAFWAEANRAVLIKSPLELMVSTLRRFELAAPDDRALLVLGRSMGQDLLQPPDVKGWRGYTAWMDTDRLLARERFLRTARDDVLQRQEGVGDFWAALDAGTAVDMVLPAVDEGSLSLSELEEGDRTEALAELILDPRYQLK